jgi:urease accessory protein UreE
MVPTDHPPVDSLRPSVARCRSRGPIRVERVLGSRHDAPFDAHLARLARLGTCEYLSLFTADLALRRLDAVGSLGTEVHVALPRHTILFDGAVIACTDHHAVVVRVIAG